MSTSTAEDRKATLAAAVAQQVRAGYRVESQSDYQAIVVKGKRTSHLLHLILTLITFGLWLLVWIPVTIANKRRALILSVDEAGRLNTQSA